MLSKMLWERASLRKTTTANNRYRTAGLLSLFSVLILSSSALADQNIHQRVSGSTSASENATAVSHTEQNAYQTTHQPQDANQILWQEIEVDTDSANHSTATTHITQSAAQTAVSGWEADPASQQLFQSAGVSNAAFDNSTSQSMTDQCGIQVYEGF